MKLKALILILIVFLAVPIAMYAGIYSTLKGIVKDEQGQPIRGASVRIMGTNLGASTKPDGTFQVLQINPGTHIVKVTYIGKKEWSKEIRFYVDKTEEIEVVLYEKVATETQTIEVTATKLVRADQQGTERNFTSDQIQGIAREGIQAIVGLSAGVFNSGDGFNIRGARASETQIRIDGLDVGNKFTGGFGLGGSTYYPIISTYAVEEVQTLTGGFSAEYGDVMGGVVNTIPKTGNTERYEGYIRWRHDIEALWGRQEYGVKLVRQGEGERLKAVREGEGAKLQGPDQHKFEFGLGGPLPFLSASTFFLSGTYTYEKYRNNSYEIYDPLGNNLGKLPNNHTWVKNLTGRLKFAISKDFDLIVGGSFGLSNFELSSSAWLYANDQGMFISKRSDGSFDTTYNGIPERIAKIPVGNQLVTNALARINHRISDNSFYQLTISNTSNNDEVAKRVGYQDPTFFGGYEVWLPQDDYIVSKGELVKEYDEYGNLKHNKIIDNYEFLTAPGKTKDGYLTADFPKINPLTGYIEGAGNSSGSNNPYGRSGAYATHGNASSFSFRKGNYWQIDGNYNLSLTGEMSHMFKTGFEMRFYQLRLHSNGLPWDGNPFFDVYTDEWGGNLYADNKNVKEKTSKPYKPFIGSFYVQDQITYKKTLIISPGLRFDFFNPNSEYRIYKTQFVSIRSDTGFAQATWKWQISPRINIAYPITERSNISLAYGIYFMMPELQSLYDGFAVDQLRGNNIIGDPNMEAQRTNAYQIAYSHQLSDIFAFDISAYYRDVYNQLGMKYVPSVPTPYFENAVAEYGNARGIEFTLRKLVDLVNGDPFGFEINYNLSSSVGTSSSPGSNYMRPKDPYTDVVAFPLSEYPQSWDRTHRVNLILNLVWGPNQGPSIGGIKFLENTQINLNGFFQSGYPYTKLDYRGNAVGEVNTERQPSIWSANLRFQKAFLLRDYFGDGAGRAQIEFFVDIYNVFNNRQVAGFYARTGDPLDNGQTFDVRPGQFSSTAYYKEANYGMAETFSADQYDSYGDRLYNINSDFDKNGIVTQEEKYLAFMRQVADNINFQGNFLAPIQVYFGLMFRF